MKEIIQVQWTCGSMEEASAVAKRLVKEGCIACANIFPMIKSIYHWQGEIQEDEEVKVLLKTTREKFNEVQGYILAHCSYEVPEISYTVFDGGNQEYFSWVESNVNR